MGALRRGGQLGMARHHPDHPHISVRLQELGGDTLSERAQGGGLLEHAIVFAGVKARFGCCGKIGLTFGLTGKSRASCHQTRNGSGRPGEGITSPPLRPVPYATWISIP